MKKTILIIISIYQKTLSPDHSWIRARYPYGYCKFYPSCSQYVKEAIMAHGVMKGVWCGVIRVLKCNPWSRGGVDMAE